MTGTGAQPVVALRSIFLTGASGLVGRSLVPRLLAAAIPTARLLTRQPGERPAAWPTGWRPVVGDLARPKAWAAELGGIDTVVHLAARTGKASRRALWAANFEATETLVGAARQAGVRRFLFVSSIAAGYPDKRHYHYANAKAAAEASVLRSGLETLIVRPLPVFGPGSPTRANLERLASLPIPVMFGAGVAMQPIHVEDLAALLTAAIGLAEWNNRTFEAGGPVVVGTEELIGMIRARRGLPVRRPIRLPLGPIRALLALLEPALLPVLPFTAGQLAAFANPAVVTRGPESVGLPPARLSLDAMLA